MHREAKKKINNLNYIRHVPAKRFPVAQKMLNLCAS